MATGFLLLALDLSVPATILNIKMPKAACQFCWYLSNRTSVEKMFEGEMLTITLTTLTTLTLTTFLLQVFFKLFFTSLVIVKSTIDPDDNFQRNP